MTAPEIRALL
jgi:hypothetical protein